MYIFSQILQIMVDFRKVQAKFSIKRRLQKYMHAKYVKNSYFMKINTKKLHVQKMFVSSAFLESGTTDFPS